MIWLFDSNSRRMSSYQTFEELCDYFNRRENLKLSNPHEYLDQEEGREGGRHDIEYEVQPMSKQPWGFIYHSHHKLLGLLEHLEEISFIQIVQEAYEEEFEMIEIFRGEILSEWIVVMPGVDGSSIMRQWCFDYADSHGFVILETVSISAA